MIQIAILGFGTVGSGIAEVIDLNQEVIRRRIPQGIHVKRILDLRDFPGSPYADRVTHDYETILSDPEISVICETMGGKEPAYTFTKKALERSISVCTSNKELVAAHGPELLKIAQEHSCSYLFEASVGGGIPIIRPLTEALSQENITSICGILNGTTNYIMTRMEQAGIGFEEALKEAQANGYAERNPEADVEGHDACRKIAILASLMCGRTVRYEDIPCGGISGVTAEDFLYARALGCVIKLLGIARRGEDGSFYVRTAPFLVPADHPLYMVSGVFNAVYVHGNTVDDLMFYGRGAGKLPTASAVVSDVIECAANTGRSVTCVWEPQVMALSDPGTEQFKYFICLEGADLQKAGELFGEVQEISLGNSAGKSEKDGVLKTAFVTRLMPESAFYAAKALAEEAGLSITTSIRLLQLQ